MAPNLPHHGMPSSIGPFRLAGSLGVGGMGTVYLGERIEQFSQRVAIKILHPDLFATGPSPTFTQEGSILTSLDHPNIVRLLDRGTSPDGLHYIIMELIDGLPIDQFCDLRRLTLNERIHLLLQVLDAVDYAHRHLVVHADLKPANILVTSEGKPRLLDFGIATLLSAPPPSHAARSHAFTRAYASPEQRNGERITVVTDVYALGILAALLLGGSTSTRPITHTLKALKAGQPEDREHLQHIAEARCTTSAALITALSGNLEAILLKAIQPTPGPDSGEARYDTVDALLDDLRRHLTGRPITARSASTLQRTGLWIRRHRLAAAMVLLLVATILLSTAGVIWQTAHATRQRRIAQERLHDLVRLTGTFEGELYDSVNPLPHSDSARNSLLQGATNTLDTLARQNANDTVIALELARQYEKLARLQLASTQPQAHAQATQNLLKAQSLLHAIPPQDASHFEAVQRLSTIAALQRE